MKANSPFFKLRRVILLAIKQIILLAIQPLASQLLCRLVHEAVPHVAALMRATLAVQACGAAAEAGDPRRSRCHSQSSTGQIVAPIANAARIAEIGRSKNGRMLPSDLISEVTKACSTMVPI